MVREEAESCEGGVYTEGRGEVNEGGGEEEEGSPTRGLRGWLDTCVGTVSRVVTYVTATPIPVFRPPQFVFLPPKMMFLTT